MKTKEEYLANKIFVSFDGNISAYAAVASNKSLESAKKIYSKIKEYEKRNGVKAELQEAKDDLLNIFGIDVKGMTKNQIYLKHQSEMINTIYSKFVEEDSYEFFK